MIKFVNFLFLLLSLNGCNDIGNNSSSSLSSSSNTPNEPSADADSIKKYFIDNYPSIEKPNYNSVSVEFLPHAKGENSLGIYKIVHLESGKKHTYFAKLCSNLIEPNIYKKLSFNKDLNKFNELSQNDSYPYFVRYKESFTILNELIEKQFKDLLKKRIGVKTLQWLC